MKSKRNGKRKVSWLAKLTPAQVRRIRQAYAQGTTMMKLAARYGVSQATISNIVRWKTYRTI